MNLKNFKIDFFSKYLFSFAELVEIKKISSKRGSYTIMTEINFHW